MTDEHARERGHNDEDQRETPIEAGMRRVLRANLDRRRFLVLSGSTMGMAILGTSGVVRAQSPAAAATQANLGDTLNLATWPNYHSQDTLDAFTAQTGVAVNLTVYGSTEEMEAKLRAGNSGIDVVVPSNYAVRGLDGRRAHRAARLQQAAGRRPALMGPVVRGPGLRSGQHVHDPQELGHDRHRLSVRQDGPTPSTSWKQFFQTWPGSSTRQEPSSSTTRSRGMGSAAVAWATASTPSIPTELAADREDADPPSSPKLYAITSDVQPPLRNYDSWLSIAWTGDGVQVVRDNPDAAATSSPSDGGELWMEATWSSPRMLPHRDAAYAFLDFILTPEMQRGRDGVLPLPPRQRQATAPAQCGRLRESSHLPPARTARPSSSYATSERDLQQPAARRDLGAHQGVLEHRWGRRRGGTDRRSGRRRRSPSC